MSDLRGKVVLIDFWTYTCINCIRTLPYLEAWQQRYGRDGFTVVGVHSPEFPFEKDASNVQAAIRQNHLTYPVVQDNDLGTWDAWGNQYWPADYLVDAQGNVRDAHFGEGDYSETERAIRTLLAEAGHTNLGSGARATAQAPSAGDITPETYLGALRAQGWVTPVHPGDQDFGHRPALSPPISSPTRATGESATRTRPRVPARRSTWSSTRVVSSWCSALQRRPDTYRSCSTASRSRRSSRAPMSAAARPRSGPSASTAWSTCRRSHSTA